MTFREALDDACLKAARELGDDIKKLSWFGRNHLHPGGGIIG